MDAERKVTSGVHDVPQCVQKRELWSLQIRVNFEPFHEETMVKFQRFPGFTLLAKHSPAVHKVATLI